MTDPQSDNVRKYTLTLRPSLIDRLKEEHRRTYPEHGKAFSPWIAIQLERILQEAGS
jgi:hypothetical protein